MLNQTKQQKKMCETCQIIVNARQSGSYDPTRTTTLRNLFSRQMRVRFDRLKRQIYDAVVTKDGFGMQEHITVFQITPRQFNFPTSKKKIEEFMKWLETQINKELLTTMYMPQLGRALAEEWTNMYILDSYKRGVIRARTEMRNAGYDVPTIEQSGGIDIIMQTPIHLDRVGILYARVFEDLKGITKAMSSQISRVLAQGMIDGDNPRVIARKLLKVITGEGKDLAITDSLGRFIPAKRRAEMLARTEIIRAHHKGAIQEMRNWGIEGVHVLAEFRTAGDERVCEQCGSMQGNTYTLDEAENLIPVHPMCRCCVIPVESEVTKIMADRTAN